MKTFEISFKQTLVYKATREIEAETEEEAWDKAEGLLETVEFDQEADDWDLEVTDVREE